jgi:hypothetical protein
MILPDSIAMHDLKASGEALKNLEKKMTQFGVRPGNRGKLTSFVAGTAEKLAISALTPGLDDAFFLDGHFGIGNDLNRHLVDMAE